MTMYLLDTDHITLHDRGNLSILHKLQQLDPADVAVSAVTVEESLRGRLAILSRRLEGPARIHAYAKFIEAVRFFGAIQVLPFNAACEDHFRLLRSLRLRTGTQDLKIAATALAHDRVLVTRNQRDFRSVPNLLLEDWSIF